MPKPKTTQNTFKNHRYNLGHKISPRIISHAVNVHALPLRKQTS